MSSPERLAFGFSHHKQRRASINRVSPMCTLGELRRRVIHKCVIDKKMSIRTSAIFIEQPRLTSQLNHLICIYKKIQHVIDL